MGDFSLSSLNASVIFCRVIEVKHCQTDYRRDECGFGKDVLRIKIDDQY